MTKVTLQDVEQNIIKQEFIAHGLLTLCILTLKNKFTVVGKAACADPQTYDVEKGKKRAREDAMQKCWNLQGYELRTRLAHIEEAGEPTGDILLLGSVKTYVGTKVVHATPMTRKQYNDFRGWVLPADEKPDDPGYLVQYADGGPTNVMGFGGYISWSPKDVFENSYSEGVLPIEGNYLTRLRKEHEQLNLQYKKLATFITGPDMAKLPVLDQQDLREQSIAMRDYLAAIGRRLARMKE